MVGTVTAASYVDLSTLCNVKMSPSHWYVHIYVSYASR
jgi:hypothetical protein